MKNIITFFFITCFLLISYNLFTNSGGPTTGVAGDPPLGETCAESGCHTGSPLNSGGGTATIICTDSLSNNVSSYIPNHTYTINLSITEGVKTRYGFEAIILKNTTTNPTVIGTIIVTDATRTQLFGGTKKYIMHRLAGIDFTVNTGSWSFKWKAPAANNGTATIYAAFNATNKSNTDAGDKIYTNSLDISGSGPFVGIDEKEIQNKISIYPNPVVDMIHLSTKELSDINIYNLEGKLFKTFTALSSPANADISELPSGIYLMRICSGNEISVLRFIKQ